MANARRRLRWQKADRNFVHSGNSIKRVDSLNHRDEAANLLHSGRRQQTDSYHRRTRAEIRAAAVDDRLMAACPLVPFFAD